MVVAELVFMDVERRGYDRADATGKIK